MRAAARRATWIAVTNTAALAAARAAALATALAVVLVACSPSDAGRAKVTADAAAAAAAPADTAASSAAVTSERATTSGSRGDHAADSVRGVVERIGSEPTARLVVREADGAVCALQMSVPPPLEGLEVTLWGRRDFTSATLIPGVACTFAAERYVVRAVDGVAATDGVLRVDGTKYAIQTADGAWRPLRDLPAPLRAQVGARVYWAGPLDRAPAAYGVLVPAQ